VTGSPTTIVLAVEDEPRNAALLQAILRPPTYELHLVTSIAGARRWLEAGEPGIVLLDRHLPDGDGLELVDELRRRPGGTHCPIVLVSASALASDRIAAELAGCDAFVAKPIRIRPFLEELERQIARSAGHLAH
jgi:CheY-like chemotaxis protein